MDARGSRVAAGRATRASPFTCEGRRGLALVKALFVDRSLVLPPVSPAGFSRFSLTLALTLSGSYCHWADSGFSDAVLMGGVYCFCTGATAGYVWLRLS